MKIKTISLLYWLNIFAAVLFSCWMLFDRPLVMIPLSDGSYLEAWINSVFYSLRWVLSGLAVLMVAAHVVFARKVAWSSSVLTKQTLFKCTSPLPFLLLAIPFLLFAGTIPIWLRSTALFYLPVAILSICVTQCSFLPFVRVTGNRSVIIGIVVLVLTSLIFGEIGLHYSEEVGSHVGDEAHYYTIAKSVREYGSLDLRQVMKDEILAGDPDCDIEKRMQSIQSSIHLSPKSRDGHWYSKHSVGLAFLLALGDPSSMESRHLILGIIAGVGCLGLYLFTLSLGCDGAISVFLPFVLFIFSMVWGGYAARSLPETLGASLMTWFAWSIFSQRRHPWLTLLFAVLACSYLPWAHFRFFPLGAVCALAFMWRGWFDVEPCKLRYIRLVSFAVVAASGYAFYFMFQSMMFDSSAAGYDVPRLLMSYPPGAWYSFVDRRGLLNIFPMFICLLAAAPVLFVKAAKYRFYIFLVMSLFVLDTALCCTTSGWINGASLPGKKLLVILPLFIPMASIIFTNCSRESRWWFIFLGMISGGYFYVISRALDQIGRGFVYGPDRLGVCISPFFDILTPFADYYWGTKYSVFDRISASIWVIVAFFLTVVLLLYPKMKTKLRRLILIVILLSGLICSLALHEQRSKPDLGAYSREVVLRKIDEGSVYLPYVDQVNISRLTSDFSETQPIVSVTTERRQVLREDGMISQPLVPVNDWSGRNIGWVTLVDPLLDVAGMKSVQITGLLHGDCKVYIAVRQGSVTLAEKEAEVAADGLVNESLTCAFREGYGDVYILLRLADGEGVFTGKYLVLTHVFQQLMP